MATYKFTHDFFFPKPEDGNLSLSTTKKRIEEALKCFQKKDKGYIELEDGTKCYNEKDLLKALGLDLDIKCPYCGKSFTLECSTLK